MANVLLGEGDTGITFGLPSPVLTPLPIVDVVLRVDLAVELVLVEVDVVVLDEVVDVIDVVEVVVLDEVVEVTDVVEVVVEDTLFIEYGSVVTADAHLLEVPVTA